MPSNALNEPVPNDFSESPILPTREDDPEGLKDLVHKEIINIGFVDGVEGGLAIDYCERVRGGKAKRIVLGFTDLGMWTAWRGILNARLWRDL